MSLKLFDFIPFRMRFQELMTLKLCTICNPNFLVILENLLVLKIWNLPEFAWSKVIIDRKLSLSLTTRLQ